MVDFGLLFCYVSVYLGVMVHGSAWQFILFWA